MSPVEVMLVDEQMPYFLMHISNINENKSCSRCGFDDSIPNIRYDQNNQCNFCSSHDLLMKQYPRNKKILKEKRESLINNIKKVGQNKKYDCIVGVSGGTDSIYTLYMAKLEGLRPLAVHFDNTWNSKIATMNIKKMLKSLKIIITFE